ncbi:hypothetical protein HAX54_022313 [Datura stramonium]|uniref:Reverse transcriptase domain-containing protein n=1 Tax=Datura stramonium TaxID=4076 RepID=A0ABS8UVA8_DATST|nr:hypothetical protein [Datura stramonium]
MVLDCDVDRDIPFILARSFLTIGRALMDSEKHEIMFRVKDKSITFKVVRGHMLLIRVGDICVFNAEHGIGKVAAHAIATLSKRKKAKSAQVKQYIYGTKGRRWVRKSHPKDGSPNL